MKKLLALIVAFGICSAAHAAAPTTESIEKLLDVMQAESMIDSIKPQIDNMMKASMQQALQGRTMSPDERKVLENFRAKSTAVVQKELTMAKLKPLYIDIYAKNFNQEEIDGLIAFYSSPTGKAFVAKMPAVMQSIMLEMPRRLNPMMQEIEKAAEEMKKELEALKKNQGK